MVMLTGSSLNDVTFPSDDAMCGWTGSDKHRTEIKLLVVFLCRSTSDKNGLQGITH